MCIFHRYKIIPKNQIHSDDEKQCCSELLTLQDKARQEWHLGKTKVEHARRLSYTHTCPNLFVSLVLDLHSCDRNRYPDQTLPLTSLRDEGTLKCLGYAVVAGFVPPNSSLHFSIIQIRHMHGFARTGLIIESRIFKAKDSSCRGCRTGSNITARVPLS